MKSYLRAVANRVYGRERLEDSALYALYLKMCAPDHWATKSREREFYRAVLADLCCDTIFDIGASGGAKSQLFSSLAVKVISVEPNATAASRLRERFRHRPSVTIVNKAVGAETGFAHLHVFDGSDEGYNTLSQKWLDELAEDGGRQRRPARSEVVEVTTLDSLITVFGTPAYVKIDVEGNELGVIQGLSHLVPLISIEANLPIFAEETMAIIERLCLLDPSSTFNFTTSEPPIKFESDRWLVKEEIICTVSSGQYRYIELYCKSPRARVAAA